MKKVLLLLFFIAGWGVSQAQTRTTVANGNATNPLTWDCMCIPAAGNTIVINHLLTLDVDFAYTSGSITVNAGASITGNSPNRILAVAGGFFTNHGTVTLANMYHSGGNFTNNGSITISNAFGSDQTASTTNAGIFVVTDSLYINTNASFTNTGNLEAEVTASAGTMSNSGTYTGNHLWTSGTVNHNSGFISMSDIYNSGTVNTNALMEITNDFWNSENIDINHDLRIGHSLYNGDTTGGGAVFNNDGLVSIAQDFTNSKTVSGSGRFCIGQGTTNSGNITGTLDICDQTGGAIDFNSGTITGTVTYCATSCNVGIDDEQTDNAVLVVPNPFNDQFEIRTNRLMPYHLTVVNAIGQQVLSSAFHATVIRLDATELPAGIYFYRLSSSDTLVSTGRLIKR